MSFERQDDVGFKRQDDKNDDPLASVRTATGLRPKEPQPPKRRRNEGLPLVPKAAYKKMPRPCVPPFAEDSQDPRRLTGAASVAAAVPYFAEDSQER